MTELKTLKDIELCDWHINDLSAKNTLKAEAVKWVIEGYNKAKEKDDSIVGIPKNHYIGWIIKFFNLNEEDKK